MPPSVQVNHRLSSKLDRRLSLNRSQQQHGSSESLLSAAKAERSKASAQPRAVTSKFTPPAQPKMKRAGSEPALNTKRLTPKAINHHVSKQATTASRQKLPRWQSMPSLNETLPRPANKKASASAATASRQQQLPRRQSMPSLDQNPARPVNKKASASAANSRSLTLSRHEVKASSVSPDASSSILPKPVKPPKNLEALMEAFPNALPIRQLVGHVTATLAHYNYGSSTLLATSLCCDEVNRDLEREFEDQYGDHFTMGGLAGFPFGGVTSFNAMAHHIPDGGSCLLVYGPHVGIDRAGNIGTVERRGRSKSGACCGSANAAASYACAVHNGLQKVDLDLSGGMDIEQQFVGQILLPHAERLDQANNIKVELPHVCYEETHKRIHKIVEHCSGEVAGNGKIALLGGIQINTPFEQEDYFLPLDFEIRTNRGTIIDTFEEAFVDGAEIMA